MHASVSKKGIAEADCSYGDKYANIWSGVRRTKTNNFIENCFI